MGKPDKTFRARFYAAPESPTEIGPRDIQHNIRARSLTAATKMAREAARANDWRLVEIWDTAEAAFEC